MKKFTVLTIALMLFSIVFVASAESPVTKTVIEGTLTRNINLPSPVTNHPVIPGESPTTGLPTSKDTYMPILVQIDNNLGALPQWGIADADIMYEFPIQGQGWTRFTALFSDTHPHEAGPVRSARTMHVDLREEWDAVFVHWGQQEVPGSDVREDLRNYGVTQKGLNIDGIGNKYQDYFERVRYHFAPHNVTFYVDKLSQLIAGLNYNFPVRPFLFTDELAYAGPAAGRITIDQRGNPDMASAFVYDQYSKGYQRFTVEGPYIDLMKPEQVLTYSNVIIQRSRLTFNNHSLNPVLREMIGEGAADIFIGGKYIAGAWSRSGAGERTVFFDQNGNEIALQRGKTWVCVADVDTIVSYEAGTLFTDNLPVVTVGAVIADKIEIDSPLAAPQEEAPANNQVVAVVEQSAEGLGEKVVEQPAGNQVVAVVEQAANNPDEMAVEQLTETSSETAKVSTSNKGPLNMRRDSKTNAKIVTRIPNGTQVTVVSSQGDWTQVRFEGKDGFVMTKYLDFAQGN